MWNHHLSAFARHTKRTKIIKGRDQIHLHITITFPIAQKKEKSGDPVSGWGRRCPVLKSTQIHFAGLRFSTLWCASPLGGGDWCQPTSSRAPTDAESPVCCWATRLPCLAVSTPKSDGSLPNVSERQMLSYLCHLKKYWPFSISPLWTTSRDDRLSVYMFGLSDWAVFLCCFCCFCGHLVVFPFSDGAQPIQYLCLKGRVDWYGCRQKKLRWNRSEVLQNLEEQLNQSE